MTLRRSRIVCAVATASTILLWAATARAQQPAVGPLDNFDLFVGPDGSKQPQDLGINAHMGLRVSGNIGASVAKAARIGIQAGVGFNASDAAVHVLDQVDSATSRRTQTFFTVGMFQRTERRLSWGLAYDAVVVHYYDDFALSQVRGEIAFDVTKDDQIGAWFTKGTHGDDAVAAGTPVRLDAIGQINFFHRHYWANAARTSVWAGVAAGHDDVVFVFTPDPRNDYVAVFGAELFVPLSHRFAVTGSANLIQPAATGTVDAYLGVSWFPKNGAMRATRSTYAPIMAVANNPTFAVNLRR